LNEQIGSGRHEPTDRRHSEEEPVTNEARRHVLIWDPSRVAADLAEILAGPPFTESLVVEHRSDTLPSTVTVPSVLHVVAPDDGRDLPVDLDAEDGGSFPHVPLPEDLATLRRPATDVVILDGCYRPDLAEQWASEGVGVIGIPGRLGRGRAGEFLRAWYARPPGESVPDSFDQAIADSGVHRLPEIVQPRLHHPGAGEAMVFRGPREAGPRESVVWYGTSRQPRGPADGIYGPEPDDALHLGRCRVRVPASVPIGRLRARRAGPPSLDRYLVSGHEQLPREEYLARIRDALARHDFGRRSVLVYVHGYRTRFLEAVTRAAQLHSDLGAPGEVAIFSWPSCGTSTGYFTDEDNAQHAERYLLAFLALLCRDTGAEHVHVLAHSMGNRPLLRVAMRIAAATPDSRDLRLGHVFLAAADVSHRFFSAEAAVYANVSDSVCAYVSSRDKALKSSGIVHGGDRAGLTPPITIVDGIDTIDASDIDLTLLGHGYYAQARPVLADIHAVLHGQERPESRFGLQRHTTQDAGVYWRFRP
jgi:esterase/lipase superfamily enzyme